MKQHNDYRSAMLADILLEFVSDPYVEASEISDAIIDELASIHDYHAEQAEKAAKVISFLGG